MDREEVRFASGERGAAPAWLFRPDAGGGRPPCVVMASGLSCVRDQRLDAFAERLAAAGLRRPRLRLPALRRQPAVSRAR